MCNKLQKKIFTALALPFAFSIFMMSAMSPAKAAEETGSVTTDTPAVTANHNAGSKSPTHAGRNGGNKTTTHTSGRNGGSKAATHASGRNGGDKSAVHASGRSGGSKATTHAARSGQTKPRAAGAHTGDKTHTQQKNTAPQKATRR